MSPPSHIIVDLVTDSFDSTRSQLVAEAQRRINGNAENSVTVLAPEQVPEAQGFPIRVSSNPIEAMFNTKTALDDSGVREFLLITGRSWKKFWENVLLHLLSPVHVWAVLGVELVQVSPGMALPDITQVEKDVTKFLQSLPGDGQVDIIRPQKIPSHMFNAGYSRRTGGVSQYPTMASLNLHFTEKKVDSIAVVNENIRRLAVAAGFDQNRIESIRVEHGKNVWVVGKDPRPLKYDGVVTNTPGLTLAAAGADCCVILLADVRTGACGAVHAGWIGTQLGAVKVALSAMMKHFGTQPEDVKASIGPSLEVTCIQPTVSDTSLSTLPESTFTLPFEIKGDEMHLDMVRANSLMLQGMGVIESNIDVSTAECTACHKDKYFSHRRDGVPFGNQWGFISCRQAV